MDLHPRHWTDEQTALGVAVVVIAVASIAGTLLEVGFVIRSSMAVLAGIIALVVTSYRLTGSLIPPDNTQTDETSD